MIGKTLLFAAVGLASWSPAFGTVVPLIVPEDDAANTVPYNYAGLYLVSGASGSGAILGPRVVATAAHVVYLDSVDQWEAANSLSFLRSHWGPVLRFITKNQGQIPAGLVRWEAYRDRTMNSDLPEGQSSLEEFNVDFAVTYFLSSVYPERGRYPPSFVDEPDEIGRLRDPHRILTVGYTADTDVVAEADVGKKFESGKVFVDVFWNGFTDVPASHYDSGNFWMASYDFADFRMGGGSSGGPVFMENELGEWEAVGLHVGGSDDPPVSIVRAIDRAAWMQVEAAADLSGQNPLKRVEVFDLMAYPRQVDLSWEDRSSGEAGYRVLRRSSDDWTVVAELGADAQSYSDFGVLPGKVYQYRVCPFDAIGNRAPFSRTLTARTGDADDQAGISLEAAELSFFHGGESSFRQVVGGMQSGKTRSMGRSSLETRLIGPGKLTFDWSVSSEASGNPQLVYDAFRFYLNGEEKAIITGEIATQKLSFDLPAGDHVLTWSYEKDPYTQLGQDAGLLESIVWENQNPGVIVPGAYTVNGSYRHAQWYGYYSYDQKPWSYHFELGYTYMIDEAGQGFWIYTMFDEVPLMWIHPAYYPNVWVPALNRFLYFYRGIGVNGTNIWFYDWATDDYINPS